jgi:hypothetical protein
MGHAVAIEAAIYRLSLIINCLQDLQDNDSRVTTVYLHKSLERSVTELAELVSYADLKESQQLTLMWVKDVYENSKLEEPMSQQDVSRRQAVLNYMVKIPLPEKHQRNNRWPSSVFHGYMPCELQLDAHDSATGKAITNLSIQSKTPDIRILNISLSANTPPRTICRFAAPYVGIHNNTQETPQISTRLQNTELTFSIDAPGYLSYQLVVFLQGFNTSTAAYYAIELTRNIK